MRLKNYQRRVVDELSQYLDKLTAGFVKFHNLVKHASEDDLQILSNVDFARQAWAECTNRPYFPVVNNLDRTVPDLYIKVPTGGGKTLIALHALHAVHSKYLRRNNGLVLWIMPSEQIYSQTLNRFKDKSDTYRKMLESSFGNNIMIKERGQPFSPHDCQGKLIIIPLMLPATNRQNHETLRLYHSNGIYADFFPDDDDYEGQASILNKTKNLDIVMDQGKQARILHSLGNVFRTQEPVVVIDEGHRAYSKLARKTILDFNPSFMIELSATPPENVNILTTVAGKELNEEGMIKLDINLAVQNTPDWKSVLDIAVGKRDELNSIADNYHTNGGRYIRPIALIQVERTSQKLFDEKLVHSETVKNYLINHHSIPAAEIAIKSSSINDLTGQDLMSPECPVNYIITKQALQEGWDCSFAYVLAILSNLSSQRAVTQLVGRVLRQPYAAKTGVTHLDECYVFTNHRDSDFVIEYLKKDLAKEGLDDLGTQITVSAGNNSSKRRSHKASIGIRPRFKNIIKSLYFPQFVVIDEGKPRLLEYDTDLLSNIDWKELSDSVSPCKMLSSSSINVTLRKIGYDLPELAEQNWQNSDFHTHGSIEPNPLVLTKKLSDLIPNAWIAHEVATNYINAVIKQENFKGEVEGTAPSQRIISNYIALIEDLRNKVISARDVLLERIFKELLSNGSLQLMLFTGTGSWTIPTKEKSESILLHRDGSCMEKTLLEEEPATDVNDLEKSVAIYLDKHAKLLWWYRNQVYGGYHIQGWKRQRVHPDLFVAKDATKVLVAEIKGGMLQGNEDTNYKRSLLELCDHLCSSVTKPRLEYWSELAKTFPKREFRFQMVDEKIWADKLAAYLNDESISI